MASHEDGAVPSRCRCKVAARSFAALKHPGVVHFGRPLRKNKKAGLASGLSGVLVERMGIEPTTSSLRTTRSPS